jgi:hypothetical protein
MQLAHQILVLLHLIGFCRAIWWLSDPNQAKESEVNASMLNGRSFFC